MSDQLEHTYNTVNQMLNEIAPFFKPEVKLTLIARTPGHPDRDFMLSIDDLNEVQKVIQRRIGK